MTAHAEMIDRLLRGVTVMGLALLCHVAEAQVAAGPTALLPPTFSESVTSYTDNGTPIVQSGTGPFDVTNGVSTAGTQYTKITEGEASINIDPTSTGEQQAMASVTWGFEVLAPPQLQSIPVPIFLSGFGVVSITPSTTVDDQTFDFASAEIYSTPNIWGYTNQTLTSPGSSHFGISVGGAVLPNMPYFITESLTAFSIPEMLGQKTDHISVSIDPELSLNINSSFPNYDEYSLIISPAPVPVPPSSWLLVTGLGAMRLVMWRRKVIAEKNAAFAAAGNGLVGGAHGWHG